MEVWFLVLYIGMGNGPAIIPYPYPNKELCESSGSEWRKVALSNSECIRAYKNENTQ